MPIRVVVDPNVWVSGLLSPSGATAAVVQAVIDGAVVAVGTPHLVDEVAAVLMRDKFRRWVTVEDAQAYVQALADRLDLHPEPGPPTRPNRDPDDDYLAALAEATGAILITGDSDLLATPAGPPTRTPRQLLDRLLSRE